VLLKVEKMKITNRQITSKKDWLKRKYGITLEERERMLKRQNYRCLICGIFEAELPKKRYKNGILKPDILNIDHCHATGKICGLLCCKCNRLLGNAKENIEILQKAIAYLTHYKKEVKSYKKRESLVEIATKLQG